MECLCSHSVEEHGGDFDPEIGASQNTGRCEMCDCNRFEAEIFLFVYAASELCFSNKSVCMEWSIEEIKKRNNFSEHDWGSVHSLLKIGSDLSVDDITDKFMEFMFGDDSGW